MEAVEVVEWLNKRVSSPNKRGGGKDETNTARAPVARTRRGAYLWKGEKMAQILLKPYDAIYVYK